MKRIKNILCILMCLSIISHFALTPAFATASGVQCEHHLEHNAECHYAEAVAGQPCSHVCDEACAEVCVHAVHDDLCGFVAEVEGSACHYECDVCAEGETEVEEPSEEPTEPSVEATEAESETTEPEVVCNCETED